jgi:imidazolonepropionase-like amidohydrolase
MTAFLAPLLAASLAITGVTLIDPASGRRAPGTTVVVTDGRIAAVGPADAVALPPGATVVPGRGRFLAPGLVDMHVHVDSPEDLGAYVTRGVTTVRNLRGRPEHLVWRAEIEAGRRQGPRLLTSGPTLGGSPLVNPDFTPVDDASTARAVVAAQKAAGYDFVKVHSRLRPEVYAALMAAAREREIPVVGHFLPEVGLPATLAAGQASLEHLSDLPGWRSDPISLATDLARAGTAVGTLLTPTYRSPAPQRYSPPSAEVRRLVRALLDAGVPILPGTDAGLPPMRPGEALGLELRFLVEAGVPPAQVLAAATSGAGDFLVRHLGPQHASGRIVPGARADLSILERDPLLDPTAALDPVEVIAAGRLVTPRN